MLGTSKMYIEDYNLVGQMITRLEIIREKRRQVDAILAMPEVVYHLNDEPTHWDEERCPILAVFDDNAHIMDLSGCFIVHDMLTAIHGSLIKKEEDLIESIKKMGVAFEANEPELPPEPEPEPEPESTPE